MQMPHTLFKDMWHSAFQCLKRPFYIYIFCIAVCLHYIKHFQHFLSKVTGPFIWLPSRYNFWKTVRHWGRKSRSRLIKKWIQMNTAITFQPESLYICFHQHLWLFDNEEKHLHDPTLLKSCFVWVTPRSRNCICAFCKAMPNLSSPTEWPHAFIKDLPTLFIPTVPSVTSLFDWFHPITLISHPPLLLPSSDLKHIDLCSFCWEEEWGGLAGLLCEKQL